ncbi:MAG: MerR family DNA-binding transcriptional regulator, partial [Anaerolineae bacterium]|nr:MerR family DNA-binding transcriptional regulator [Anaerolineae bacterium]
MSSRYLRTTDIAYAVGVHPNTVRQYEEWGLLPSIPRTPSGYRMFKETHLDQMRLARTTMAFTWLGGDIRRASYAMIQQAAAGNLGGALESAYQVLVLVQSERAQAEVAATLLERWAHGTVTDATIDPMSIGKAAKFLNVTSDMLRNWERNGLLKVPRNPNNGYRVYGAKELGRLRVIRVLRRSGYSMMAILRMLLQLDKGERDGLRYTLDTPGPDEDIGHATDKWLSTLEGAEPRIRDTIAQLEMMLQKSALKPPIREDHASGLDGRDVVVKQFTDIVLEVLDCITPGIHSSQYRLFGPIAGLLSGMFQPVKQITFLVPTNECVREFAQSLHTYPQVQKPAFIEGENVYRAAHLIRGFEITIEMRTGVSDGNLG